MDGRACPSATEYHHVLGVPVGADVDDIKAAYRREARRWHPDVCKAPEAAMRMRRINLAREALCGPGPSVEVTDPPCPAVDPVAVDFGTVRSICHHGPTTVRVRNAGGPVSCVRIDPEEGAFWSIGEVRGGADEGEIAELDLEVDPARMTPGAHTDELRLSLDDIDVTVRLTVVVECEAAPAVTLWTSAVLGLIAGAAVGFGRGGLSEIDLLLGAVVGLLVIAAGALAGKMKSWPKNWSTWWPAATWSDDVVAATGTLRHQLSWPKEVLPAGHRWTSACVDAYAYTAGVGPVRAVFTARRFAAQAGYRPDAPSRMYAARGSIVYLPWTVRLHRGATERAVAHQVAHLAWPPFRHDAAFFERVQALIDAVPCCACAQRLRTEAKCGS